MSDHSEASRRARLAWCLYDWANSAFPTIIVTFVFSTYFVKSVAEDEISGAVQWGYALSLSGVAIAIIAPIHDCILSVTPVNLSASDTPASTAGIAMMTTNETRSDWK